MTRCPSREPSPGHTQTCYLSEGRLLAWDQLPCCTRTCHPSLGRLPDLDTSLNSTWTCDLSRGCHTVWDPSPSCSRTRHPSGSHTGDHYTSAACPRNCHLSGGRYCDQDPSPFCRPSAGPGPVAQPYPDLSSFGRLLHHLGPITSRSRTRDPAGSRAGDHYTAAGRSQSFVRKLLW